MLNIRKQYLAIVVATSLAAPAAFAQSAADASTDARAGTQATTPAVPATPASPAMKSWTELDANGNGTLSAT